MPSRMRRHSPRSYLSNGDRAVVLRAHSRGGSNDGYRTAKGARPRTADGVRFPRRSGSGCHTLNTALVVMGDKLGLYRAMAGGGALTPGELAARAGLGERYVHEWLNAQAAGGFVDYDPDSARYALPPEQTAALTDESSPAYLPGFFQIALGSVLDSPRIAEAFKTGAGIGWHDHVGDVHEGCERFFRPGYNANLVSSWLPALDGVVDKLVNGAAVADVGCGHGASTVLMAESFPRSTFSGFDYHDGSIAVARQRADAAGVSDRAHFEVSSATSYPGGPYDFVTMFDCLHDMGDPIGAARHVLSSLAPDGTWLIVEPAAGDRVEGNLGPSAALTTVSPRCCARPPRWPRRSVWHSGRRPARPGSATLLRRPASGVFGGRQKLPSTSCSRPGPERGRGDGCFSGFTS